MLFATNPRHRRRRRRSSNRGSRRRYHRRRRSNASNPRRRRRGRGRRRYSNPSGLSLRSPVSAITAGFKPSTLTSGAVIAGGYLGNQWLNSFAAGMVPLGFVKSGIGKNLLGIGTAGLLGAAVGMLAPRFAGQVFAGGIGQVMVSFIQDRLSGRSLMSGLGFGDYLTPMNAADARPLGYFGDYLTPMNAADARPLGGLSGLGDATVSEELAAL